LARSLSSPLCLRVVCSFLLLPLLLSGCAQRTPTGTTTPLHPLVKHGNVSGGQEPVSGATMQLYAVGTTGDGSAATPLLTSAVTTDAHGDFDVTGKYTCPSPSALVYITGSGGNPGLPAGMSNPSLSLMAALGPCGNLSASTVIVINELTTVAAIWPLAPFISSSSAVGSSPSDAPALASAFTLAEAYADTSSGTVPGLNVPSGTTVPVTEINTLADVLATCTNSAGGSTGDGSPCGALFAAATPAGGTAPTNVIGAGINIATNPTINVSNIFALAQPTAPFQPTLTAAPPNWAVQLATTTGGLSVSPAAITFPDANLGFSSTTQTLTVTNVGSTTIALNLSLVGSASTDFNWGQMLENNCASIAGILYAGNSCILQITFTPSAVGARNASLLISSNAPNSPQTIPLTGTGLAGSGGPITLSPSSLTFTLAGVPQAVTVTNYGSTSVEIGSINVSAGSISAASETNNCGTVLAAQSICTIEVQATFLSTIANSGTLTVIDSATAGTQTLPISIPTASADFSAAPINFGAWALGITSSSQSAGINSGDYYVAAPPFTSSITGPNAADFSPSAPFSCFGSISTCTESITFRPSSLGAETATLVTNFGNIQLTGNGIPDGPSFTLTPPPGYLGSQVVGSPDVANEANYSVVTNNGSTPLTLNFALTGANAGDFTVTNQCAGPGHTVNLAPAATCQFNLIFSPSQSGLRTATLTVTDSTSEISQAFPLEGMGDPLAPTVSPQSLTFGNTEIGTQSAAQLVSVSAPNGDPVTFTLSSEYSSSINNMFVISSGTCATQTPCQLSVTFKPTATGTQQTILLATDAVTGAGSDISVQGTGGVGSVSLSQTSLTFTARNEGTTSIPQTITLTNTGDATLVISGTTFIGANVADFPIQGNTCGSSVAAGANCTISISFDPSASGSRSAILQITSNAASSPDTVQLSGTGN
jgi:trimeric autotransporter adhesin